VRPRPERAQRRILRVAVVQRAGAQGAVRHHYAARLALTCGLSYADQKCLWPIACGPTIPIDNVCSSHGATSHTIEIICPGGDCKHNIPTPAQGYITIYDGDFGVGSGDIGFGYWHQELADGITDTTLSQRFVLPQGAACGFHHTYTSPGRTCMGLDPTYQCPDGWTQRRAHDADGSLIGAVTGTGQYWVWCEYDDPNHYSARTISSFPGHFIVGLPPLGTSPTTGIACGISHNAGGGQTFPLSAPPLSTVTVEGGIRIPERAPWSAVRYNDHSLLLIDVAVGSADATTTMTVRGISAAGSEFDRLTLVRRRDGAVRSAVEAVAPAAGAVAVSSSVRCAGLHRARERRSPSSGPSHASQFPTGWPGSCPR